QGEQCDQGVANGSATSCCTSTCQFRASGQQCRGTAGVCDQAETCTGSSATCPTDIFLPSTTSCRSAAGECDPQENCTGSSAACPADQKKPSQTACSDDGNPCSIDVCDGITVNCTHFPGNPGATCRAAAGLCDVAETCTGASTTCPADQL